MRLRSSGGRERRGEVRGGGSGDCGDCGDCGDGIGVGVGLDDSGEEE